MKYYMLTWVGFVGGSTVSMKYDEEKRKEEAMYPKSQDCSCLDCIAKRHLAAIQKEQENR